MEINQRNIMEMLYEAIAELNDLHSSSRRLKLEPSTMLGEELDSLGFVNLVAMIEDMCGERFRRNIVFDRLAEEMERRDPFESVGALGQFIECALTECLAAWR